jgi:sialate O-acetylesterase
MPRFTFILLLCLQALNVAGQLKVNGLFANNAVFQQNVPIPVWGKAEEGEKITVSFAGHARSAVTRNGRWMVEIPPVAGGFTSYELTVTGSKQKLVLRDILVGEVWLSSGQSNMAFPMRAIKPLPGFESLDSLVAEAVGYSSIRQFTIPLKKTEDIPVIRDEIAGSWLKAGKNTLGQFSAVAYFFARELYKTLNVPVGIVHISYGGTAIENWMSRDTLDKMEAAKDIFSNYQKQLKQFPAALSKYKAEEAQLMSSFRNDSLAAVAVSYTHLRAHETG